MKNIMLLLTQSFFGCFRGMTRVAFVSIFLLGFHVEVTAQQVKNLPDRLYIEDDLDGAGGLFVADLNSDNEPDVIATGWNANAVVWYEAPGWTKHIIDDDILWPQCVCAADLDNDDDLDVVAVGWEGEISWYEAPDWEKHTIDTTVYGAFGVDIGDIDGDNKPDIATVAFVADDVVWYKNPTWEKHLIDSLYGPTSVQIVDLDGNGSMDIVAGCSDKIVWYDTDNWHKNVIDSAEVGFGGISIGDINNDKLSDVVTRGSDPGEVYWYEAPDWEQHIIDEDLKIARHTCVSDMDGDEDLDVIACGWGGEVAWYKAPTWDKQYIDTVLTGSAGLCVADINDDNKPDVISTSVVNNWVVWYDILSDLDVYPDKLPYNFILEQNRPNPFNPTTVIGYQLSALNNVQLSIYNLLGQRVVTLVNERQPAGIYTVEWNATGFASGVYYYSFEVGEFRSVRKMVLVR